MLTKSPRGTKDVTPSESYKWQHLEKVFSEVCHEFGYSEVRTPTFEHTELFERGVGESTDVVQKEMYTFEDKGGRSITLKAEGTAPAARLFIENKLYTEAQPTKVFYITPVFRYERPQKGRLREHHQFGVEVFGSDHPSIDAEVISLVNTLYRRLHIEGVELHINSIGCPECRGHYDDVLKKYLSTKLGSLCTTCNVRFDKNPMRILDCKNDQCQAELEDAPLMIDYLCEDCKIHFEKVQNYLEILKIQFIVDPKIVRGLDYYTKTAFEFISSDIGAKSTICGGGRYDGLIENLGGPATPGIGFGMGIERLMLAVENNNIELPKARGLDIFIVTIGERAEMEAFKLLYQLRNHGIAADKDHLGRSIKAQFKYADKTNSNFTIVIGDDEIDKDVVTLKNMESGIQEEIKLSKLLETLQERIGGN